MQVAIINPVNYVLRAIARIDSVISETRVAMTQVFPGGAAVDNPDGVSVAQSETDGGIRLDVSVADGDMGRVIGKRGRVASAIRTVVRAAVVDDDVTAIEVEFVD